MFLPDFILSLFQGSSLMKFEPHNLLVTSQVFTHWALPLNTEHYQAQFICVIFFFFF